MSKRIEAYECSYCGMSMICSYESMVEHEKMCNCNPNKEYHHCLLCIHSRTRSYDTTDRFGKPKTVYFGECKKDTEIKFNDFYSYCSEFKRKESEESNEKPK